MKLPSKNPLVYVARSKIHGRGLFARQPIKKGEIIGTLTGQFTTKDGSHVLWISESKGIRVRCDLRYINHSQSPNAVYYDSLEVCALKDISVDEEITHNYNGG